ncbi:MAG: hypothetical protein ABI379_08315 [Rhodanobacter sp.]
MRKLFAAALWCLLSTPVLAAECVSTIARLVGRSESIGRSIGLRMGIGARGLVRQRSMVGAGRQRSTPE